MSNRWRCAICFETKVVPVINSGCGHTYCDGCFKAAKTCPSCRKAVTRLIVNYELVNDHTPAITVTAAPDGCNSEFMYAAAERVNDLQTTILNGRNKLIQNAVDYVLKQIHLKRELLIKGNGIYCLLDLDDYDDSLKQDIYKAVEDLLKDKFVYSYYCRFNELRLHIRIQ